MKNLFLLFALCLVLEGAVANSKDYVNVTHVQDTFMATFVHTTPLKDYVIGVSISTLNVQKAFHNITLSYDEAWTDLCLDIVLGSPLPESLKELLPPIFLDLRVFYRVNAKEEDTATDGIMCPMSMMMCSDGTYVGFTVVNGKCSLVCPTAVGNISMAEMKSIQQEFESEYMETAPYSHFIIGDGISSLLIMNATHNVTLDANEHWTDLCLIVLLNKHPAISDFRLPTLYKGARVFYRVGKIWPDVMHGDTMFSFVVPIGVFLFALFLVVGCCMRRRKCKQACKARASVLRAPEQPVAAPQMMPADFAVEMYPPQYEYGVQYDFQAQQEPVMMAPPGYPVFIPQHGWFLPVPQEQQQEE